MIVVCSMCGRSSTLSAKRTPAKKKIVCAHTCCEQHCRTHDLPAHAPSSDSNWMITLDASSASSRRCLAGGSTMATLARWGDGLSNCAATHVFFVGTRDAVFMRSCVA